MIRFVKKILAGLVAIAACVCSVIAARMFLLKKAFDDTYKLNPGTKVLLVGSSQIGCSFNAQSSYKILWVEASPPQIVLLRLQRFMDCNSSNDLKVVATDFGPQTFCLQSRERMPRFWYRELPLTCSHLREMPCAVSHFLAFACSHLQMPFNFDQKWDGAGRPSLAGKSQEWKHERLAETLKSHYSHYAPPPQSGGSVNFEGWWRMTVDPYVSMKEVCDEKGLYFVVVAFPTTGYYRAAIPDCARRDFDKALDFLGERGVCVVDLRRLEMDDKYFCDAIHLTEKGADVLTDSFLDELKRRGIEP